ncbi:hypothetical protein PAPHI01_0605 [Pancytospora philotis]|nr:hypothetical protein PAPHI01_0605 [Pancytospora philotis]
MQITVGREFEQLETAPTMKLLGAHLSIAKGLGKLQMQMEGLKCEACALFLKSQRRLATKPLEESAVQDFKDKVRHPERLLPHGSYLVNLANPEIVERSYANLIDDMQRCKALGIRYYNIHPGSDVKQRGDEALAAIAAQINRAHAEVADVVVLLENMAGQGNVCGKTFEELAFMIARVDDKSRIGVTLDTCHMFAAGYDIRTAEAFEATMQQFDRTVGLGYLKAMHLNDSKFPLGARKDRHEQIGKGHIGLEAFRYIMNSSHFEDIPMVLETPDGDKYAEEIALLKSLVADDGH